MSHLLFTDDTLLFFKAKEEQANRIKNVIDNFATCTGQLINPAKCSIQFSKQCPLADQEATQQTLQVEKQVFEAKYLGLPTPEGRMKRGKF